MKNPLVSVIIPTYNRKRFLLKALKSVVNQTYVNIEILVIDDGSETNYAESICGQYSNCKYLYKKNGGLSSARNFGVRQSEGSFIAFLDDDDFWEPFKIEQQVKILIEDEGIDCVHSSAKVVDENDNLTGEIIGASKNKAHKRSGNVFWNALGVWVVKSPTPLIRKTVFKRDMMFDETIRVGEDIDFYQRMFYRHKIFYVMEPLAFYREYENPKRLSLQKEKYIGLEKKMYINFLNMGIYSPWILYKISSVLLKLSIYRWEDLNPDREIQISKFKRFLFPKFYLMNLERYFY